MDILGSILSSMDKPPSLGDKEKALAKKQRELHERQKQQEKQRIKKLRDKTSEQINRFVQDADKQNVEFEPMNKLDRSIVHEIAEVAGLTAFSFGEEEVDRHVMCWKKEFAPCDEELAALRKGEVWDPQKAKELAKQRELDRIQDEADSRQRKKVIPAKDYKEKYVHLLGRDSAKDAARKTDANKQYGFVPSENKRDLRSIEQTMADIQARKKQKLEEEHKNDDTEHEAV